MLKVRVIPTLLYKSVGLVKGVGFNSWRRVDTVLPAIKVYNMREVDELILLDIEATNEKRDPDYDEIRDFSRECFVPFCVGGGICNIEQIRQLLRAGADKVAINTAAYNDIALITEGADLFGSQCIVASIDCRNIDGEYHCFSNDGTVDTGYMVEVIRRVTSCVSVPVIASGGAGNYEHMREAVMDGGASAVAAASIYHFTEQTPREAKEYLQEHGVAVRLM